MLKSIVGICLLLVCSIANCQESSIVRIAGSKSYRTPEGFTATESWYGTGAIIKILDDNIAGDMRRVRILTAAHVVKEAQKITVKTLGGTESSMTVRKIGDVENNDIAIGETVIPDSYEAIEISTAIPESNQEVVIFGLAGRASQFPDIGPRRLVTKRIGTLFNDSRHYYDYPVSPGDSGGPILLDGKIAGVVSGGMRQEKSELGFNTWPLISAKTENIQKMNE